MRMIVALVVAFAALTIGCGPSSSSSSSPTPATVKGVIEKELAQYGPVVDFQKLNGKMEDLGQKVYTFYFRLTVRIDKDDLYAWFDENRRFVRVASCLQVTYPPHSLCDEPTWAAKEDSYRSAGFDQTLHKELRAAYLPPGSAYTIEGDARFELTDNGWQYERTSRTRLGYCRNLQVPQVDARQCYELQKW